MALRRTRWWQELCAWRNYITVLVTPLLCAPVLSIGTPVSYCRRDILQPLIIILCSLRVQVRLRLLAFFYRKVATCQLCYTCTILIIIKHLYNSIPVTAPLSSFSFPHSHTQTHVIKPVGLGKHSLVHIIATPSPHTHSSCLYVRMCVCICA